MKAQADNTSHPKTGLALEALGPADGEVVPLLPEIQRRVLALPTVEERAAFLRDNPAADNGAWRASAPLVLRFRAVGDTSLVRDGPWKVLIGKKPDLSDARAFAFLKGPESGPGAADGGGSVYSLEIPDANLETGARYFWKVSVRGVCGCECRPGHGCDASRTEAESPTASFETEAGGIRWITLEGKGLGNIRDLGGRIGLSGRRVRQGMIFRGCALNGKSVTRDMPGRNLLTMEDAAFLTGVLGMRTDLDLRRPGETAGLPVSPMGPGVRLVKRPSPWYNVVFADAEARRAMAENFREFCDPGGYPFYFHCTAGADRTGSLAWVLEAVLGVARRDVETDYESTFYPVVPDANPDRTFWQRFSHLDDGFAQYGGPFTPWDERIVLFLKDEGVTDGEIDTFRSIMLE